MKVRLDRLGDEPYAWQEDLALTGQDLGNPDVLAMSGIACRGRLSRTAPGFRLEVSVTYDQTLACTRCLGEIQAAVDARIDLLVLMDETARIDEGTREHELDSDDLGILVLPSPLLDTRPLVVEQVQLNVPMKLLCGEDCAGLCPECGADRNAGACDCRPSVDIRWSALAKWKEQHGDD